jgi:hypothetical protein
MKVVYVAGPYRAPDAWRVEQNIRAAEEVAFEVAKLGHSYICPHTNARYFDGTLTAQFWIDMTMQLMLRCDGVVLAPGWEDSAGSLGEIAEAQRRNLPIHRFDYLNVPKLERWLDRLG